MADQTADAGQPGPAIQDFYPDDLAVCYGCGRLNAEGMHVRTSAATTTLRRPTSSGQATSVKVASIGVGARYSISSFAVTQRS